MNREHARHDPVMTTCQKRLWCVARKTSNAQKRATKEGCSGIDASLLTSFVDEWNKRTRTKSGVVVLGSK